MGALKNYLMMERAFVEIFGKKRIGNLVNLQGRNRYDNIVSDILSWLP